MPVFAIPAVLGGVIAGGSSIASGLIGSSAASNAAKTQANAANYAAQLENQAANRSMDIQQQQFNIGQQNIQPWLQQGQAGLANLSYLMGLPMGGGAQAQPGTAQPVAGLPTGVRGGPLQDVPQLFGSGGDTVGQQQVNTNAAAGRDANGNVIASQGGGAGVPLSSLVNPSLGAAGSLMQPWTKQFVAPTNVTEQNDPGYQFRLQQGQQAIERSAAARGGLLSGGTAKAQQRYGQDYASNEYGNVYNRAFNDYANQYNVFQNNQTNQYNRLASMSGVGQTAANQLNMLGQNYANNSSNILMNSAAQQGQQANNAAAARASGYIGGANAWGGALSGIGNNLTSLYLMNQMGALNGGGGIPPIPDYSSSLMQGLKG